MTTFQKSQSKKPPRPLVCRRDVLFDVQPHVSLRKRPAPGNARPRHVCAPFTAGTGCSIPRVPLTRAGISRALRDCPPDRSRAGGTCGFSPRKRPAPGNTRPRMALAPFTAGTGCSIPRVPLTRAGISRALRDCPPDRSRAGGTCSFSPRKRPAPGNARPRMALAPFTAGTGCSIPARGAKSPRHKAGAFCMTRAGIEPTLTA